MTLKLSVSGDEKVLARIKRLERELPGVTTAACVKAAEVVAAAAKAKAPRDGGTLADSIMVQPAKLGAWVRADAVTDDDNEYAGHVEYGTGSMPARPYLRPAVDGNKAKAGSAAGREFDRQLESAVRKMGATA